MSDLVDEVVDAAAWSLPTRVVSGAGAMDTLPLVLRVGAHVLVVVDRHVATTAIVTELEDRLRRVDVDWIVVDEQPALARLKKLASDRRVPPGSVVIGIGGGSTLDTAKMLALGMENRGAFADDYWSVPKGIVSLSPRLRRTTRLIQVPTTIGTGAEVNPSACVLDEVGRKRLVQHPQLAAQVALIDPRIVRDLPRRLVASGAVEILTRLLLPYLSDARARDRTIVQDATSRALMSVVIEQTPLALATPRDERAIFALAVASANTWLGWPNVGRPPFGNPLWLVANPIAARLAIPKGIVCAALLPGLLNECPPTGASRERWEVLAPLLGAAADAGDPGSVFESLFRSWGVPGVEVLSVDDRTRSLVLSEIQDLWSGYVEGPIVAQITSIVRALPRAAAAPTDRRACLEAPT
jgi:alcohol dehydrogenase class IV